MMNQKFFLCSKRNPQPHIFYHRNSPVVKMSYNENVESHKLVKFSCYKEIFSNEFTERRDLYNMKSLLRLLLTDPVLLYCSSPQHDLLLV